jgi:hypothetical protein
VLNHLGVATSIKDNVLAVSSTNRYRQKVYDPFVEFGLIEVCHVDLVQTGRIGAIEFEYIYGIITGISWWVSHLDTG